MMRLILCEHLCRRLPSWLFLEIDIRERLIVVIANDKAGGLFLNGPRAAESGELGDLLRRTDRRTRITMRAAVAAHI
jgi:hypothetical protein